jgi:hypothetical protein
VTCLKSIQKIQIHGEKSYGDQFNC